MFSSPIRELRHAVRRLWRSPGFAAAAILTLALGIGANTAIFSLVRGVLLEPLPYHQGEDLVVLRQQTSTAGNVPFSIAEFFDYRDGIESLDLVEHHAMSFTLLGREKPERVSTGVVSHDFFEVLGTRPLHGRFFEPADEKPGAEAVLVLANGYWQRSFGGDPEVVGQTFQMNNRPHTVIGVLPPIPQFPAEHDVYMPTSACPFRAAGQESMAENRSAFRNLTVFGRLGDAVGIDRASNDAMTILGRFEPDHPETYGDIEGFGVRAVPLGEELTRNARPMILLLIATTGLVLLLACTNVANLTLARMLARQREMAVRASIGASNAQIRGLSIFESTLVALLGGGLGIGIAHGGLDLLRNFMSRFTPRAETVEVDATVLAFTCALVLLTGLGLGLVPSLPGNRTSLAEALREGVNNTDSGSRLRLRGALVAAQVAVSVVLLVAAGLLLRSFDRLQRVDPGFDADRVLSARIALNWTKYDNAEKSRDFYRRLLERLEGHPEVMSAAVGSVAPLTQQGTMSSDLWVENRPLEEGQPAPSVNETFVSAAYFDTLRIPLTAGRVFDSRDHQEAPLVAVIGRALAERHFRNRTHGAHDAHEGVDDGRTTSAASRLDIVGQRISLDRGQTWLEVVGVVGDVHQFGLDQAAAEIVYRPLEQTGFSNRLLVRSRSEPERMAREIEAAVHAVDPEQPVESIEAMADTRQSTLETPRTTTFLLGLFALLALGITAAGVGSVVAYSVGRRTREIGIRMALGADSGKVLALVLKQGLGMVLVGVVLGLGGALAFGHLLADLLFRTGVRDPLVLLSVPTVLLFAAFVACLGPALRAIHLDPNRALRSD